jgi:hypothetical protein
MDGTPIRIRRSAVPGKRPTIEQLLSGELAYNTYDGELTARRDRPGIGTDIIRIGAGTTVTNVLYVTTDGNDNNTGEKLGDAKKTIRGAIAAATTGTVIKVSAGSYIENNPIKIPEQVSIVGDSLREVTVTPQNQGDLFYVSNGNYIAEMSFVGPANNGAIFAFNPEEVGYFNQSPYIQNCTNFIPDSIGLKVDGKYAIGPTKSMVLDSYTQYNQGGIGASMTNEGYAQLVSLFTICNNISVYCGTGGACDLTNSNSSFGNFALISEGVGPLKYTGSISVAAEENRDTFTVDLSVPQFNIVDALYDNTTGVLTAYTDQPHQFSVGMGVTLTGLEFSCPSGPGIVTYPSGNKGYVFETRTVAPGRFVDASNLVRANRTEIQDKSLAAIALNHPDFIFPGDSGSDERYRFYDSYRLIQQNKREIVDKSLASIAIGFGTGFSFPTDPVPYEQNRYFDAYRLIISNKEEIVQTSYEQTVLQFPDFDFDDVEVKCKRDIGYFVDAIATDVFIGGNTYARGFVLQYFDENGNPISNGLVGEETQSIFAYQFARDLIKVVVTDQALVSGISSGPAIYGSGGPIIPNTDVINACTDVKNTIDTLAGIVTTSIGAGSTSLLPSQNLGISTTNVCARDLGYLVDAVSTDIFTGGNTYSIAFTKFYFDKDGNPISDGLLGEEAESVYAFNTARELMKKAITNQLNAKDLSLTVDPLTNSNIDPASCANVQSNINTLINIVTQTISQGNLNSLNSITPNPGTFTDGGLKCRRDIGLIIDAIANDLEGYTNKNIINATKAYFNANGQPITNGLVGEEAESVTAFNAVRDYSKLAINNLLNIQDLTIQSDPITGSNKDEDSCANVKSTIDTLISILTTNISAGTLNNLPQVSLASTVFSAYVGTSTLPHTYEGGGVVKINVVRPFDGQVIYFGELFYTVGKILIFNGGSGYLNSPEITIEEPDTDFGVPAQAVCEIRDESVISIDMVSTGRGYTYAPKITITGPEVGINTAIGVPIMVPTYYSILSSTPVVAGICTITVNDNVPYEVGIGTEVPFFKQSRVLAAGQSLEYIGSGTEIAKALPLSGGVPIQENETDARDGGLVVFTSTDQSGNFRIGDGVVINQQTGTISGTFYSKSLFSTLTPFILALGGD